MCVATLWLTAVLARSLVISSLACRQSDAADEYATAVRLVVVQTRLIFCPKWVWRLPDALEDQDEWRSSVQLEHDDYQRRRWQ